MPPHEPITIDWMKVRLEKIEAQMKSKRAKDPMIRSAIQIERVGFFRFDVSNPKVIHNIKHFK